MFQEHGVTVEPHFVRFGGKSYAIDKINSIEVRSETKPGSKSYIGWGLLTAILALYAVFNHSFGALIFAAVPGFLTWKSWNMREPVTTYGLFVVTSSGEAEAFATADRDAIDRLQRAIETAMSDKR